MATYVLLSSLTPEGRESLHKSPDRLGAVNEEIEKLGCKVLTQYALMGQYDFVTIIEAPDFNAYFAFEMSSAEVVGHLFGYWLSQ